MGTSYTTQGKLKGDEVENQEDEKKRDHDIYNLLGRMMANKKKRRRTMIKIRNKHV